MEEIEERARKGNLEIRLKRSRFMLILHVFVEHLDKIHTIRTIYLNKTQNLFINDILTLSFLSLRTYYILLDELNNRLKVQRNNISFRQFKKITINAMIHLLKEKEFSRMASLIIV